LNKNTELLKKKFVQNNSVPFRNGHFFIIIILIL